jgi:hypothetical protein
MDHLHLLQRKKWGPRDSSDYKYKPPSPNYLFIHALMNYLPGTVLRTEVSRINSVIISSGRSHLERHRHSDTYV